MSLYKGVVFGSDMTVGEECSREFTRDRTLT